MTKRSCESNHRKDPSDIILEGYDYLGNSASATDCTGLIPSNPLSEAERESYEDVYHYQPKAAPGNSAKEKEKEG